MTTHIVKEADTQEVPFDIPEATTGGFTAKLLNTDTNNGPVTASMTMAPGSHIPRHYHSGAEEIFYVLEGDFINEGISYGPGAFFAVARGEHHGPHDSQHGCRVLFMQTALVGPDDFHVVRSADSSSL